MEESFYPPYCIEGVNMDNLHIICPVRGQLKVKKKSKDGLTPKEEFLELKQLSI